jgi:hypothetical protein
MVVPKLVLHLSKPARRHEVGVVGGYDYLDVASVTPSEKTIVTSTNHLIRHQIHKVVF